VHQRDILSATSSAHLYIL